MLQLGIRVHCAKLTMSIFRIAVIINSHEGQEARSQTGTCCPLPDLWRGAGREVRTR
jgi:hypothetical protein